MERTEKIELIANTIWKAFDEQGGYHVGAFDFQPNKTTSIDGNFDLRAVADAVLSALESGSDTGTIAPVA